MQANYRKRGIMAVKHKITNGVTGVNICGETLLVATGDARGRVPYARTINETASFLWNLLEKGADDDEMTSALMREYEIDSSTADQAVTSFIEMLKKSHYIEE